MKESMGRYSSSSCCTNIVLLAITIIDELSEFSQLATSWLGGAGRETSGTCITIFRDKSGSFV